LFCDPHVDESIRICLGECAYPDTSGDISGEYEDILVRSAELNEPIADPLPDLPSLCRPPIWNE
jgi:hypothetical protein